MPNQIPVKPINEIEVKSEVSENDKILILDSESEEARLASKDELKGDTGATITSAAFVGDDIVFTKDDSDTVTLENAKSELEGPKGDKGEQGDPGTDAWEYMTRAEYDALPDTKLTDNISRMIYDEVGGVLKVLLREYNNILHYNNQDELYADLQFESGLTPVSAFPIGVSVGNVEENDGWEYSGVLLNARTDETYIRRLYADDGKLYFDNGNGIFKAIATTDDISSALSSLRNELSTVAFTGLSSDLNNDAEFTADKVLTRAEYEAMGDVTDSDDKRYFLYTQIN